MTSLRSVDGGRQAPTTPDLGDMVVMLLVSTLAGLHDHLMEDGFEDAAELVWRFVEIGDGYLTRLG